MTPVEVVLSKLPHARRSGDSWRAACPAHDGSRPDSLKVREGRDHEALLYCFAGCPLRDVVSAMGLEMRDLFVRDDDWKPEPRRKPEPLPAEFDDFLETLRNRREWPFEWEAAKLLARLPIELARQDGRQNWDYLSARGNVRFIVLTADMIRRKGHTYPHSDGAVGYVATAPHCSGCDSEACVCVERRHHPGKLRQGDRLRRWGSPSPARPQEEDPERAHRHRPVPRWGVRSRERRPSQPVHGGPSRRGLPAGASITWACP